MTRPDIIFEGAFTALVTPFVPDGSVVDWEQLKANVEFQIQNGINGLVPVGTTGECPTLSHEEHEAVVSAVIKQSGGRVPVIAGAGSNCTMEAVRLVKHAKQMGADAALVVNPYYNKPNQQGLYEHFKALGDIGLPLVLYNIPGRTNVNMEPKTVAMLYQEVPQIVAIKEATGSLDQTSEITCLCDIAVLSGDDSLTLPLMSVGAKGVISVLSNLDPKLVTTITSACLKGDFPTAQKQHRKLFPLMRAMFCEVNPQPVKACMAMLGRGSDTCRLPLVTCSDQNKQNLKLALKNQQLL